MTLFKKKHTDAELVEGMRAGKPALQSALYDTLHHYFTQHFRSLFFASDTDSRRDEIFQNAFITLWEHIESQRLTVNDGQLAGRDGQPLKASLTTYFMSIARFKYLEGAREPSDADLNEAITAYDEQDEDNAQTEILSDLVATMPRRCYEILTKFYYEAKTLDVILQEIPSIRSKDALKTKKYKCMETLRNSARDLYRQYLKQA